MPITSSQPATTYRSSVTANARKLAADPYVLASFLLALGNSVSASCPCPRVVKQGMSSR